MTRKRSQIAAFTLVELLVVIGIIAVLIAILMPTIVGARRAADAAKCASNMRQVGMALVQYSLQNRQYIPCARNDRFFNVPWYRVIQKETTMQQTLGRAYIPYALAENIIETKGIQVLNCPANTRVAQGCTWAMTTAGGDCTRFRRLDNGFPSPSEDVILTDASAYAPSPIAFNYIVGTADNTWYRASALHNRRSNVLFADIHVSAIPEKASTKSGLDLPDRCFTESKGFQ